MRTYRVVYRLYDGSYHTQDIMAANKVAAYDFRDFWNHWH